MAATWVNIVAQKPQRSKLLQMKKLVNVHAMVYELVWWVKVIHHVSLVPRLSCSPAQRRVWHSMCAYIA